MVKQGCWLQCVFVRVNLVEGMGERASIDPAWCWGSRRAGWILSMPLPLIATFPQHAAPEQTFCSDLSNPPIAHHASNNIAVREHRPRCQELFPYSGLANRQHFRIYHQWSSRHTVCLRSSLIDK
jgi:hypothetical protein